MKSIALSVALMLAAMAPAWAQEEPRTLSVVGQAQVAAVPDMAVISLGVTHMDGVAKTAMDRVSSDSRALLAQLTQLGVAERDVQTDQLRVSPVWDHSNNTRVITGFVASNSVSVRVRDLATLGEILDAALAAGSNNFNGLRFDLQDRSDIEAKARAAAVKDAMMRANQMAEAAGVALGSIRTMSEQVGGAERPEMFAAARASDVPVAPGEVDVSARVAVTFDLQP